MRAGRRRDVTRTVLGGRTRRLFAILGMAAGGWLLAAAGAAHGDDSAPSGDGMAAPVEEIVAGVEETPDAPGGAEGLSAPEPPAPEADDSEGGASVGGEGRGGSGEADVAEEPRGATGRADRSVSDAAEPTAGTAAASLAATVESAASTADSARHAATRATSTLGDLGAEAAQPVVSPLRAALDDAPSEAAGLTDPSAAPPLDEPEGQQGGTAAAAPEPFGDLSGRDGLRFPDSEGGDAAESNRGQEGENSPRSAEPGLVSGPAADVPAPGTGKSVMKAGAAHPLRPAPPSGPDGGTASVVGASSAPVVHAACGLPVSRADLPELPAWCALSPAPAPEALSGARGDPSFSPD